MKMPNDLFNKEQLEKLKGIGIEFDFNKDYSGDEIADIEEELEDAMLDYGFTDGNPNEHCKFWENIFDTFQDNVDK